MHRRYAVWIALLLLVIHWLKFAPHMHLNLLILPYNLSSMNTSALVSTSSRMRHNFSFDDYFSVRDSFKKKNSKRSATCVFVWRRCMFLNRKCYRVWGAAVQKSNEMKNQNVLSLTRIAHTLISWRPRSNTTISLFRAVEWNGNSRTEQSHRENEN